MKENIKFLPEEQVKLFWSYVDVGSPDECWPWIKCLSSGYGVLNSRRFGRHLAHHIAIFLAKGFNGKLFVLHSCDNRACCNPSHLSYGTQGDNIRDAASKGRMATQVNPKLAQGINNGHAKLTEDQVKEIYSSLLSVKDLAAIFGIHQESARSIKQGRTWAHLAQSEQHAKNLLDMK